MIAWSYMLYSPYINFQCGTKPNKVYRLSLQPLFIQIDYSFCGISSWVHYVVASWHRHKLRISDLSRGCFKDSEHYLTYKVQSVGTLQKENMILLSESTKKQSQLFFLSHVRQLLNLFYLTCYSTGVTGYSIV